MSDLNILVQLIQSLYSPTTPPSQHQEIQKRLQEAQSSDAAWSIVGPLLESSDPNIRFFGASTLALKISQSWAELSPEHHDSLKSSTLSWLSASAAASYPAGADRQPKPGERVVLRKLAAAVTSLSLRLDDKWEDWLLEVIMRVAAGDGTPQGGSSREAVLEVLSVVIEQVTRADLVGPKRAAYMTRLASSHSHVVSTLSSSLSSADSYAEVNSALSCFSAFLIAGQIPHASLSTLYPLLLPPLSVAETAVEACAAVQEVIERSSGYSPGAPMTRFVSRPLTDELITGWVCSPWVKSIIAGAVEEQEAEDEALAVMKLVCAIAEHALTYIFKPGTSTHSTHRFLTLESPEILELFRLVLAVTCFPGYATESFSTGELGLGVWMSLQEECSDEGLVSGDGDTREGRGGREAEWPVVRTIFGALADALRQRATWPASETYKTLPKDIIDGIRIHRDTMVAETLLYVYYILRDSMLGGLVDLAAQQVSVLESTGRFEDLEATLFCLFAIQEGTMSDEATHLPRLFSPAILGRLPTTGYPLLRATTLRLVGAYSSWFTTQPDACISAVSFIVPALEQPSLSSAAARALRLLCDDNRKTLVPHVGSFVAVLGGLEGKIEDSELVKVLESVSSVIQALPEDQIVEPLLTLANPIVAKLQSSVDNFAQLPTEARELCLQQLSYLVACAKGLADPEGDLVDLDASFDDSQVQRETSSRLLRDSRVAAMRERLAAAFEGTAKLWASDLEVGQALADFVKHTSSDSIPSPLTLDPLSLLSLATSVFQASLSPVWIAIATSLLARLARDQNDSQLSDEQLAAVIRYFPRVLASLPAHLDAVITFGERGLGMQERFSLKATIDLLVASVQQSRMESSSASIFRQTVLTHCRPLLHSLLQSIGGAVPRSHLQALSELLHACILRMPDETRVAMRELLAAPGWPTDKASDDAKSKFEKAVLGARNGRLVRTAVSDFALCCRGLDGSSYGAASLAVFD
ncbi:Importin 13 [Pseudohyphozyma bogoriensis]|nr:Importin 13 [Pseudohyphozyma bogoriensis]